MSNLQLRNFAIQSAKLLAACLIVLAIYGLFLFAIGIPKTQARNLYNQAHLQIKDGDIAKGVKLLEEAYQAWPEAYIKEELQLVQNLDMGTQE